ncbi:MAG: RHS repeat-associated core domain-containing protein [Oscillospiraceae bacterium]|nr:RHS repeat-associated core domain-containing protein [Oscillospiraceae bacterium]
MNDIPYFYVRNLQGDVVSVIDIDGNVVAWYTYCAWGNILDYGGELARVNPITYRGYYFDWELGLYYLQSRYYCPALRRFISADVFLDTGVGILGTNMYAYCNNDPVNLSDPTGFSPVIDLGGGWWAWKQQPHTSTGQYHWHVWRGVRSGYTNARAKFSLNLDGSKHDKGSWSDPGGPPNRVKNRLQQRTGFDWDATRKDYVNNADNIVNLEVRHISQCLMGLRGSTYFMRAELADGSVHDYSTIGSNLMPHIQGPSGVMVPLPSGAWVSASALVVQGIGVLYAGVIAAVTPKPVIFKKPILLGF